MPYGKITINYSGQCKTNFLWRTDTIVYTDDTIYISFNMFNRTIFIFKHLFFKNIIYLTLILVKNCGVWILFKAHPNPIKNFKIKYPGTYGIVLSSECSVHILLNNGMFVTFWKFLAINLDIELNTLHKFIDYLSVSWWTVVNMIFEHQSRKKIFWIHTWSSFPSSGFGVGFWFTGGQTIPWITKHTTNTYNMCLMVI